MMWKYVFNDVEMYIWLWKYTFLFMSGYGRDESVPTPNGVFAPHFVGVCGYFTDCLLAFCGMFATLSQSVRSRRGRFIVPAYTYTPTKWGTNARLR